MNELNVSAGRSERKQKVRQIIFSTFFSLGGLVRTQQKEALFPQVAFSNMRYCSMNEKEIQLCKWWRTPSARAAFRRVAAAKKIKAKEMKRRFAEAAARKARAMALE